MPTVTESDLVEIIYPSGERVNVSKAAADILCRKAGCVDPIKEKAAKDAAIKAAKDAEDKIAKEKEERKAWFAKRRAGKKQ